MDKMTDVGGLGPLGYAMIGNGALLLLLLILLAYFVHKVRKEYRMREKERRDSADYVYPTVPGYKCQTLPRRKKSHVDFVVSPPPPQLASAMHPPTIHGPAAPYWIPMGYATLPLPVGPHRCQRSQGCKQVTYAQEEPSSAAGHTGSLHKKTNLDEFYGKY